MAAPGSGASLHAQVVIVGGGPTGLTLAHCLGLWGVRTVLLERQTAPSRHPRATLVNVRTMEIFRLLGIADAVRRAGVPLELSARVTWVSTLAGAEIGHLDIIETADKLMRLATQSPAFPAICPQNRLETILASALDAWPSVQALTGYEAVRISARSRGVAVDFVKSAGASGPDRVEADYAVLAEGLHGWLREQAGIGSTTSPPLGRLLDIHFAAELQRWTAGRESALYWILNPVIRGVVITVDPAAGEWLLEVPALSGDDEQLFSESCDHAGLVAAAIGAQASPAIRSVRMWSMGSTWATRWRDATGRVFVAGDAAHTFPPTGGFGMNTGVQDAHNLGWRLAGTLQGWASSACLDFYERERRPVAEFNDRQSELNAVQMRDFLSRDAGVLADPGSAGAGARTALAPLIEAQRPHFDFQGQALGFRYPQPLEAPRTVVPDVVDYVPSAEVGARGPHAWLDGSSGLVSTCDLTRRGFALLTLAEAAAPWLAAIGSMRSATPVPVEVFPVGAAGSPAGCLSDVHGSVRELYGLRGRSAILLRPDGHVQAHLNGIDLDQELARGLADISVPRSRREGSGHD